MAKTRQPESLMRLRFGVILLMKKTRVVVLSLLALFSCSGFLLMTREEPISEEKSTRQSVSITSAGERSETENPSLSEISPERGASMRHAAMPVMSPEVQKWYQLAGLFSRTAVGWGDYLAYSEASLLALHKQGDAKATLLLAEKYWHPRSALASSEFNRQMLTELESLAVGGSLGAIDALAKWHSKLSTYARDDLKAPVQVVKDSRKMTAVFEYVLHRIRFDSELGVDEESVFASIEDPIAGVAKADKSEMMEIRIRAKQLYDSWSAKRAQAGLPPFENVSPIYVRTYEHAMSNYLGEVLAESE